MKTNFASFIVGFLFALGLSLAGMTQPQKVVGFLDIFGAWDPTLLFVMVGAICVHFGTYQLIRKKSRPLWSARWHIPDRRDINPPLILGSLIFGIGWGLAGYCPGPAITALASFELRPFVFVAAMVIGMMLFRLVHSQRKKV